MKKISLAAPAVRFGCVLGDVLIAGAAMFWLTLAFSWWALLVVALAGLLIGFYNVQVFRSVVFVDPGAKTVTLRGIQARTDQVAGASKVYTREVLVNGQTTRVIVIEGEDHSQLSIISTLNTINHGYASEIAAREVAGALGVQLAVPAYYFGEYYPKPTIGDALRPIEPEDIRRANKMMYAESLLALLLGLAIRGVIL